MQKIIEVQNLIKSYGNTEAVRGISFSVQKGEIFGLLGPNGAGKTTTLEIIEGLKRQTQGQVFVLGLDNLKQTDEIKKRIGIQLQTSQYLNHLTLNELLVLFASLYSKKIDTNQLLDMVNLESKKNEEFKNLSGGQKQRFTIATSLVNKPEVLFLDEPTTGLDPKARRDLWKLVKELNAKGITVVLTTHYMEEAEYLCHRVGIMHKGKILEIDEPKKLIDRLSDTTQISFFTDSAIEKSFFESLPGVSRAYSNLPKIILEIPSLDQISNIVRLLREKGVVFYGFTVKTASLEDVYLDLTGQEYGEDNDPSF